MHSIDCDGNADLAKMRRTEACGSADELSSAITRGYLEFTFKAEYAYDYGMPQWLASWITPSRHSTWNDYSWQAQIQSFPVWYRMPSPSTFEKQLLDSRALGGPISTARRGSDRKRTS